MREILNPLSFGFFALSVLINKVLRRLLPLLSIVLAAASLYLSQFSIWAAFIFWTTVTVFCLSLAHPFIARFTANGSSLSSPLLRKAVEIGATAHYLCLGSLGTLLGLLDFLMNKQVEKWQPEKG